MKMADGGFRPADNVQFAADTRSGAVAGVSVDTVGSDKGRMAPMSEALAAAYGRRRREPLADGGFAKLDDIELLARGRGDGLRSGTGPQGPHPRPSRPATG